MRKIIILISILSIVLSCGSNRITGINKQNGNFENGSNSSEDSNSNNQENGSNSSGNQGGSIGGNNNSSASKDKLNIYIANKIKNPMETDNYFLLTGFGGFDSPDDIVLELSGEDADHLIATATQLSLKLKVISIEGVDSKLFSDNKKVKELLHRGGTYSGQIVDLRGKNFSTDVFNISIKRAPSSGKISVIMKADTKLAKELKKYVNTSKDTSLVKVSMECSTDKIQKATTTLEFYIVVSSI